MKYGPCETCPPSCIGQEVATSCGFYSGPDIPEHSIKNGDCLTDVIQKLGGIIIVNNDNSSATTDDIVTRSFIRNPSAACASGVVERNFDYELTANVSTSGFSWNLLNVTSQLPVDYEVALVSVKAIGQDNGTGTIIIDSNKLSAGFGADLNRYPITVDFTVRLLTPCGNLDLLKSIIVPAPANKKNKATFLVNSIVQDQSDDIILTTQLDGLESEVQQVNNRLDDFENIDLTGQSQDLKQAVTNNDFQISGLKGTVANPSSFEINYVNDDNALTDELGLLITDLYSQIKILDDKLIAQGITIATLQDEVKALNSQI